MLKKENLKAIKGEILGMLLGGAQTSFKIARQPTKTPADARVMSRPTEDAACSDSTRGQQKLPDSLKEKGLI